MSEHKVTENLVQRNAVTTATLTCSCGLSVEGSLRRKPLRALRVELARLHEASPADNGGEVCGPKTKNPDSDDQDMTPGETVMDAEPEDTLDEGDAKS